MNKEMFNGLLEMDEIVKGQKKASSSFDYPEPKVKAIDDRKGIYQE